MRARLAADHLVSTTQRCRKDTDVPAAFRYFETGQAFGKVVITLG